VLLLLSNWANLPEVLSQPDIRGHLHRTEGNMRSILKGLLGLYVAFGLITFGYQIPSRYPICSEANVCGLSMTKGVVWSAIWPAYWVIQLGLLK
jgi:hypothetical protein